MGAHQSFPSMILINLGSGMTILIEASSMTWKNTSACMGVLQATPFAKSSASVVLFLSMCSIVNHLK
jgi:hypothetical protein